MVDEPRPDIDYIGGFDKYIGMTVKMEDETRFGGSIATMKRYATYENKFAVVGARNNPLMDTQEYEFQLKDGKNDRYFSNVIAENQYY